MSHIAFYGDPHGDFEPLLEAVSTRSDISAVVILGDCDLPRPLKEELQPVFSRGVSVFWIPGNHDTDNNLWYARLFNSAPDGNLHGRTTIVDSIRIGGLGGVFRGKIWDPELPSAEARWKSPADLVTHTPLQSRWEGGLPLRHRSTIFPVDYDALKTQALDILVTHEAPTTHEHGFAALDQLAESTGARLLVHGHHHHSYEAQLACGTRVRGLAIAEPWLLDVSGLGA